MGDESDLLEVAMVDDPLFCVPVALPLRFSVLFFGSSFILLAFLCLSLSSNLSRLHLGIGTESTTFVDLKL